MREKWGTHKTESVIEKIFLQLLDRNPLGSLAVEFLLVPSAVRVGKIITLVMYLPESPSGRFGPAMKQPPEALNALRRREVH
jgi:hypothetical protein